MHPENADAHVLSIHERADGCVGYPVVLHRRVNGGDARHERVRGYAPSDHECVGGRGVRSDATRHPMPSIARPKPVEL